jgi:hypothetical protein
MIRNVVSKHNLHDSQAKLDLEYWLSRTPEERVEAVEILRRQFYGVAATARLQRVVRVIKREPR